MENMVYAAIIRTVIPKNAGDTSTRLGAIQNLHTAEYQRVRSVTALPTLVNWWSGLVDLSTLTLSLGTELRCVKINASTAGPCFLWLWPVAPTIADGPVGFKAGDLLVPDANEPWDTATDTPKTRAPFRFSVSSNPLEINFNFLTAPGVAKLWDVPSQTWINPSNPQAPQLAFCFSSTLSTYTTLSPGFETSITFSFAPTANVTV